MRTRFASPVFGLIATLSLLAGCGGAGPRADAQAKLAASPSPAEQVLDHSLYAKNESGGLSEAELQEILSSPIDLVFPARVGVVPLGEAFDPQQTPSVHLRGTAADSFARTLRGSTGAFSHVSDISTDLPHPGGIEGLRVLAARYRLRYLLLYSERFEDASHVNAWAWLYPTLIGIFVTPSMTVESYGLAQVDLLDVRTGTVLFSVMEPMQVDSDQLLVHADRAHAERQRAAASEAAKILAKRVANQTDLLVAYADDFARRGYAADTRLLPAPIPPPEEVARRVQALAGDPGEPVAPAAELPAPAAALGEQP